MSSEFSPIDFTGRARMVDVGSKPHQLRIARAAGLIPLCHPISLDQVRVEARLLEDAVEVTAEVRSTGPTGVEMEALTAVGIALLTVYDRCKSEDKTMAISDIHLVDKTKI